MPSGMLQASVSSPSCRLAPQYLPNRLTIGSPCTGQARAGHVPALHYRYHVSYTDCVESGPRRLRDLTLIVLAMGLVEAVFAGALMVAFEGDRITARQMVVTAFELGAAIALPLEVVLLTATAAVAVWRRLRSRYP